MVKLIPDVAYLSCQQHFRNHVHCTCINFGPDVPYLEFDKCSKLPYALFLTLVGDINSKAGQS